MKEFDLLDHIYRANAALGPGVTIPPGDDMGAVRIGDANVLVTVDQLADGVHVDAAVTPLDRIGRKAMTRSLSDVAAMAAKPVGAVVAVCLPKDFGRSRADGLFDAMRRTGEAYDCPLIGGDISMWDNPLLLTVTILAEPAGIDPVTRPGALAGDIVCVTGRLGGSLETVDGRTHHLDFEPRIEFARKLAGDPATRPNCMIDLSDGLARDLGHLCRAAGLSAEVDAQAIPVSPHAVAASKRDGLPEWVHALSDGEDYELCFTIDAKRAKANLPDQIDRIPITQVGKILDRPAETDAQVSVRLPDGQIKPVTDWGWEHRGT